MKNKIVCIGLIVLCAISSSAFAWDGTPEGKIAAIDVTAGGNYGFRVYLQGYPSLCTKQADGQPGDTWAYINETDSNYKTYVSVLLAAKTAGTRVKLHTTNTTGSRCKIGYITSW